MRLLRRVSGQVLVLLVLMIVTVMGIASLAVDVGVAYGLKAKLNSAVDAAAIAALKERTSATGNDESAITAASEYLEANFPYKSLGVPHPSYDISISGNNGAFVATVTATTVSPTVLAKVIGWRGLTVSAKSEATRSDLDLALVLDTTGSLDPVFDIVQARTGEFVNRFNPNYDRIALVPFATGVAMTDVGGELVLTDGVEINKSARGFNKSEIANAIANLRAEGQTDSELGLRMGIIELNKVKNPAARRAIVFFSDGAPNVFTGKFEVQGSAEPEHGNLYSMIRDDKNNEGTYDPRDISAANLRHDKKPKKLKLKKLPQNGGGNRIGSVDLTPELPITTSQRRLSLDAKGNELKCSANSAARNLVENVANYARSQGIVIYSLGYGYQLEQPEMSGSNCPGIDKEVGSLIMKRVANTRDSDTYNPGQPSGIYCHAPTADQLAPCYDAIINALLRLTR
jgi:Flp pilus assembly protein TadG